jgi:hypothetical protein
MVGAFRHVGDGELRRGDWRPIACTAISGEEFAGRFGVDFVENDGRQDAPGPMAYAAVELAAGEQFTLEHHLDHPTLHVVIYGLPDPDRRAQLARFTDALGLPHTDLQLALDDDGWFDPRTGERVPDKPWPCRVRFPDDFAEQAAMIEANGWFADLVVETPDGRTYRPVFYDPVRLNQVVTDELDRGARLFRQPNLVVIPRVTEVHMLGAISQLSSDDFTGLLPEPTT